MTANNISRERTKPSTVAPYWPHWKNLEEISFVLIRSNRRAQKNWLPSGIWSASHHLSEAEERSGLAAGTHGRCRRRWKWVTSVYWWCDHWGEQDFIFSHHCRWLTALPALAWLPKRRLFTLLTRPSGSAKNKRGVWLNGWLFIKMNERDIFNGLFLSINKVNDSCGLEKSRWHWKKKKC